MGNAASIKVSHDSTGLTVRLAEGRVFITFAIDPEKPTVRSMHITALVTESNSSKSVIRVFNITDAIDPSTYGSTLQEAVAAVNQALLDYDLLEAPTQPKWLVASRNWLWKHWCLLTHRRSHFLVRQSSRVQAKRCLKCDNHWVEWLHPE